MDPTLAPRTRNLVASLLEQPDLAVRIRELPPRALARVVEEIGLEDASEIVALATREQLLVVLDDDVWKSAAPGEDERFDAHRFLTWLEVLVEAGDRVVAEKLSGLPEDLLVLALHRHVLVFPLERLASEIGNAEDGDLADKALSDHLHEELDDMILVARGHDGWDAILSAVLALDREHHALVVRVLSRCAALADDEIEESGGLHDLLTREGALEEDVAGEREDRRAADGFVAGSSAKSFLTLARRPLAEGPYTRDVVTRAWFRDATARSVPAPALALHRTTELLPPVAPEAVPEENVLSRAMRALASSDARAFAARSEELAYLANVLRAGAGHEGRHLRDGEAVVGALATVSLGLDRVCGKRNADDDLARVLVARTADELFRRGFHALHTEVVLPAAARAVEVLRGAADAAGPDLARAADRLANAAARGEPWKERDALELVALHGPDGGEALAALVAELPRRAGVLARPGAPYLASGADLAQVEEWLRAGCVARAHRHRRA